VEVRLSTTWVEEQLQILLQRLDVDDLGNFEVFLVLAEIVVLVLLYNV
jgi:hypothetical protein